jgi:hypothetical protein
MAASILKRARERRDAALREAHMWEEFIRRYEELRKAPPPAAPTLFAMREADPPRAAVHQRERRPADERAVPSDSEMAKTIALVDAVLDERGRPVQLHDLYNEVTRRGLSIAGRFPRANLGARLSIAGKYVSMDKKTGWWFRDRPCPAGAFNAPPIDAEPQDEEVKTPNNGELFDAPWGNAA